MTAVHTFNALGTDDRFVTSSIPVGDERQPGDVQPGDALQRTQRATFNVTWSPVPQTDIGFEFLTGTRVNKDGQSAASNQVQVGWTYRF